MTRGTQGVTTLVNAARSQFFSTRTSPWLSFVVDGVFTAKAPAGQYTETQTKALEALAARRLILNDDRRVARDKENALSTPLNARANSLVYLNGNVSGAGISVFSTQATLVLPEDKKVRAISGSARSAEQLWLAAQIEQRFPGIGRLFYAGATPLSAGLLSTALKTTHTIDASNPATLMRTLKSPETDELTALVIRKPKLPEEEVLETLSESAGIEDIHKLTSYLMHHRNPEVQIFGKALLEQMNPFSQFQIASWSTQLREVIGGSLAEARGCLAEHMDEPGQWDDLPLVMRR